MSMHAYSEQLVGMSDDQLGFEIYSLILQVRDLSGHEWQEAANLLQCCQAEAKRRGKWNVWEQAQKQLADERKRMRRCGT